MRSLKENLHGMVDLGVVLAIGIAFVGLIVVAYLIFTIKTAMWGTGWKDIGTVEQNSAYNLSFNQAGNITKGFDNAIALILVAITIWILAIAISALLILRGRQE
jgi:hypothetical protein